MSVADQSGPLALMTQASTMVDAPGMVATILAATFVVALRSRS